jgi:hypothetical protein
MILSIAEFWGGVDQNFEKFPDEGLGTNGITADRGRFRAAWLGSQ